MVDIQLNILIWELQNWKLFSFKVTKFYWNYNIFEKWSSINIKNPERVKRNVMSSV